MARYCDHYVERGTFFSTYKYCNITGEEKEVNQDYYCNYCSNYNNVGSCPLYSKAYGSVSSCFITTVVCDVLNKEDDDEVMNALREFRSNVMRKDEKYYDMLKEYDVIGPLLALSIAIDKNSKKISTVIYEDILTPISKLINDEQYEIAIEKYYLMTLMLINYYGLKRTYNNIKDNHYYYEDFNPTTAGHGKKKKYQLD